MIFSQIVWSFYRFPSFEFDKDLKKKNYKKCVNIFSALRAQVQLMAPVHYVQLMAPGPSHGAINGSGPSRDAINGSGSVFTDCVQLMAPGPPRRTLRGPPVAIWPIPEWLRDPPVGP